MSGGSKGNPFDIDGGWDEAAPPDPALSKATVRPPTPLVASEPMPFSDVPPPLGEAADAADAVDVHIEMEAEPKIDIAAASRAANTAAAMGRAPRPRTTTKMKALDLAEALARSTAADDERDKKK